MKKPIRNINNKNQLHGYNEKYWNNNLLLWIRGNFKKNLSVGYTESHYYKQTRFYIK